MPVTFGISATEGVGKGRALCMHIISPGSMWLYSMCLRENLARQAKLRLKLFPPMSPLEVLCQERAGKSSLLIIQITNSICRGGGFGTTVNFLLCPKTQKFCLTPGCRFLR